MKKYFLFLGILFHLSFFLNLQSEEIDSLDLPAMIGGSNSGTLFYMTFHPCWETSNKDNALKIYIASKYKTNVTLEIEGLGYIQTKTTIPNDVIEFSLKPEQGQPYTKTDAQKPLPEQIWEGRAIKITSDDPIICYGVTRFYATSDGYLALPVSVLGNEYQVSSYADPSNNSAQWLPSYTSIVGVHDDTKVRFTLGGFESCYALRENGGYLKHGETIIRTLNSGDVWLIPGIGPFNDLTGSTITGDKPFAVISGNFCSYIPSPVGACDFIIEQELPMYNWGKKYLVSPVNSRKTYSIIKIFAREYDTKVYNNGELIGTINSPGGIVNEGYFEIRAGKLKNPTDIPQPVIITGDKPINVVQYNTGSMDDGVENDPFQMQIQPIEQFQNDIIFNTPGIRNGYGFKNNYVNIIYKATIENKIPADLMFAEVIDSSFVWMPLIQYSSDPGLKFSIPEDDDRFYFSKTIKLPHDGVYRIKSNDNMAVYAYGSDYYDSYGFPAAGMLLDMTTDDSDQPTIVLEKDKDGNISGDVEDKEGLPCLIKKDGEMVQAVTKPSGLSVVSIIKEYTENYKFTCKEFIPGIDNSTSFKLEIIDKLKPAKVVLAISDRRGNDTILTFGIDPVSIPSISGLYNSFGVMKSSKEELRIFKIENTTNFNTVPVKSIILENENTQFEILDNIPSETVLKKGESHTFTVKFKSKELNTENISLSDGKFTNRIGFELSNGTLNYFNTIEAEVANPQIEVKDVNFSTKNFGETYKQEFLYIYNKGKTPLEISGFEFPANSPFKFTLPDVSLEKPLIIKPNGEFYIRTNFEPTEPGEYSATLKIISDGFPLKNEAKITGAVLATSVNEDIILSSDISVNYSDGKITFDSKLDYLINNIEICDINGRIIHSGQINESIKNYSLSLPGLVKGIYMVKFTINNITLNRKIII